MAWVALMFGTSHVLIMGVEGWDDYETWPGGLPPITMTATVIPILVLFLKLIEVNLSFFAWVCGVKTPRTNDRELNDIRALIQESSEYSGGNESDGSGGARSTTSTLSFNIVTGDVEANLDD